MSRARLLVISLSDLGRDPRVDRQLRALAGHYEVAAAGLGRPAVPGVEYIDLAVKPSPVSALVNQAAGATRMISRRYELAYWGHYLMSQARQRLRGVSADAIISNDVPALPLSFAIAERAPVLLDAHEYTPLQFEDRWMWRVVLQPYMTALTRRFVPRVAAITTVSQGLADAYRPFASVAPTVLTNAPARRNLKPQPVGNPVRLLHHGIALPSRKLEHLVEMMGYLGDGFSLDLVLVEQHRAYMRRLRRLASRDERIRVLDPVPMRGIVELANNYDIGVSLVPPVNFNYRHALPNKLFEFIQARLAVAIGPTNEMARLVRAWDCGLVAPNFEPATLAARLREVTADQLRQYKENSHAAAVVLNAEANAAVMRGVVERALMSSRSAEACRKQVSYR